MTTHQLGLVEMTNDEYHAGPGVSKSHLDKINQSPLHYWHAYLNPDRVRAAPTPSMVLGTAIHTAVLEPDLLPAQFVRGEKFDRRTTAGKAAAAAFELEHAGKTVLEPDSYDAVLAVRDAVHRHPLAAGLLRGGQAEQSFFALDQETGELVKCRVDYFNPEAGMIVDLKSTGDASPAGFARSVANYRYHVQQPWYQDILKSLYGEAPPYWAFLAVETTPPYAIGVYFLEADDVALGRREARRDLRHIARCRAANHWPDYGTEAQELELPGWARSRIVAALGEED